MRNKHTFYKNLEETIYVYNREKLISTWRQDHRPSARPSKDVHQLPTSPSLSLLPEGTTKTEIPIQGYDH